MSSDALRVLAIAYKEIDTLPQEPPTSKIWNAA